MIAVAIIALTIAVTSVGGLIYFALLATRLAQANTDAVTGREADQVRAANVATAVVDAERKSDEDRLHADESRVHDQIEAVATGSDGDGDPLLASLAAHPALSTEHHSAVPGVPALPAGGPPGARDAGERR